MKKLMAIAVTLILCVCGFSGCGTAEDANADGLTNVTLVLDWTPNTNHTGIYVAQEKGWFTDEGLSVTIQQPPENGASLLVASGGADFGIDFQDYLADVFGIEEPLPVTAVAAIMQHNTSGIVSPTEYGITSPSKMAGRTYATWELPIEQAILKQVVIEDGGNYDDITMIPSTVTDITSAFTADIDSVWIYYGWDGIACEEAGLDTNFFYFTDIDPIFDYYSPVIIANNDFLAKNPETAKAFLRAVKKGYEYADAHPEEAAKILCAQVPELDAAFIEASQKWISGRYQDDATSWGVIDPQRWNGFYQWVNENDLLEYDIPENYGFSNDYLN